jgi:hypothetical protein
MGQHPTVVHWAANRHRQDLLAEAAADRRTTATGRSNRAFARLAQTLGHSVSVVVSRLVDEFEPLPGPRSAGAGRLPAWMRA